LSPLVDYGSVSNSYEIFQLDPPKTFVFISVWAVGGLRCPSAVARKGGRLKPNIHSCIGIRLRGFHCFRWSCTARQGKEKRRTFLKISEVFFQNQSLLCTPGSVFRNSNQDQATRENGSRSETLEEMGKIAVRFWRATGSDRLAATWEEGERAVGVLGHNLSSKSEHSVN